MDEIANELEALAAEIAKAGEPGWPNTLLALAARVRRLRAPEQREGWTTVTDDEKTWVPMRTQLIVMDTDRGARPTSYSGQGDNAFRPLGVVAWIRMSDLLPPWPTAQGGGQGERPSPQVGAQEDGLHESPSGESRANPESST